jgi:hypothetical protein
MSTGRRDRLVLAVVPLVAVAFVAVRYRDNWYLYDAFTMIERVLEPEPVRGAFEPINGHLYLVAFVVYRAQVAIGLHGHLVVWAAFCSILVACNLAVALTLRAAQVPVFAAVAAGVLVTYFGPGSQLMTVEFQLGMVGAIATSYFAAWLVLSRQPSPGAAAGVCALLVGSLLSDSGTAAAGIVFVAVLLGLRWRDRWAVVACAPAFAAVTVYSAVAGSGPVWSTDVGGGIRFAVRLVCTAAGGLVGGGEVAGGALLAGSAVIIVAGLRAGRVPAPAVACLSAGSAAVVVMTGLITVTRAGLVRNDLVNFNRHVAMVAIFLVAALLPPLVAVARSLAGPRASWVEPVVVMVVAAAFVLNLEPMHQYRRTAEGWMQQTRALTVEAVRQLEIGCANGREPSDAAMPLGSLAPQVTVRLLREIERRDLLEPRTGPVSPAVRDAMCTR